MTEKSICLQFSDEVLEASFDLIVSFASGFELEVCCVHFFERIRNSKSHTFDSNRRIKSVRKHIEIIDEVVSVRSLPFLTSEMSESLTLLQSEVAASWDSLLTMQCVKTAALQSADKAVLEKIDSLTLTFLEWMTDVEFLSSSESDQRKYLSEFPFNQFGGVR